MKSVPEARMHLKSFTLDDDDCEMRSSLDEDCIRQERKSASSRDVQVEVCVSPQTVPSTTEPRGCPDEIISNKLTLLHKVRTQHSRLPGLRRIPFPAIGII